MKYTLAVAALLGDVSALAAYTTQVDGTTTYNAAEATGKVSIKCSDVLRNQNANPWHYHSQKIYKTANTGKTVDLTTEVVCKEGPTTTANKCTTAETHGKYFHLLGKAWHVQAE